MRVSSVFLPFTVTHFFSLCGSILSTRSFASDALEKAEAILGLVSFSYL